MGEIEEDKTCSGFAVEDKTSWSLLDEGIVLEGVMGLMLSEILEEAITEIEEWVITGGEDKANSAREIVTGLTIRNKLERVMTGVAEYNGCVDIVAVGSTGLLILNDFEGNVE